MTRYDFERKLFGLLALRLGEKSVPVFNEQKLDDAYRLYKFCKAVSSANDADSRAGRTDDKLESRGISLCLMSRNDMWIELAIAVRIQALSFVFFDETPRTTNIVDALLCCDKIGVSHNRTKGCGDLIFTIGEFCKNPVSGETFYCMDANYDEGEPNRESWADHIAKEIGYATALEGDIAIFDDGGDGVSYIFDEVERAGFPLSKLCNVTPRFIVHSQENVYDLSEIGFCGDYVEMLAGGALSMLKAGCLSMTFIADPDQGGEAEIKFGARNKWQDKEQ